MSSNIVFGITLKPDGFGNFTGQVTGASDAVKKFAQDAKTSNTQAAAASEQFTASLKRQADTLGMGKTQLMAYEASQHKFTAAQRASVEQSVLAIDAYDKKEAALGRMRVAAIAAATATTALLLAALKSSVAQAAEAEQSHLRLAAVLRGTGYAAGLTKVDLDNMAESMKLKFGIDDDALRDSMAVLLTFKNVSRASFGESLEVAANLAAVMKTDLSSAVMQLGKALENPDEGLTALNRSGVSFNDSQKEMIKQMVETGRQAEAITVILKIMKEQGLDGVAEAMNSGITKATRDAGLAWDDLLKAIGGTFVIKGTTEAVFGSLAKHLDDMRRVINDGDWLDRLAFFTVGMTTPSMQKNRPSIASTSDASTANEGLARQQEAQRQEILAAARKKEAEEAAKKAPEAAKKHASDYAGLIKNLEQNLGAAAAKHAGLNAEQTELAKIQASPLWDTLNKNQREYITALLDGTSALNEQARAEAGMNKAREEATTFIDRMNNSARQTVADLEFRTSLEGKSAQEAARLTAERKAMLAVDQQIFDLNQKYKNDLPARDAAVAEIEAARPGIVNNAVATAGASAIADAHEKEAKRAEQAWERFSENVQRNLGDELYKGLSGSFMDIGDMFKQMLLRMAADAAAAQIMVAGTNLALALFGGGAPGATTPGGAGTATGGGGFAPSANVAAKGAWFDGGAAHFFASGGAFSNQTFDQPTPFKFASGGGFNLGVMGEAGPEAVMPLSRDASGKLGVKAQGGARSISITYAPVIQIDSRSDRSQVERLVSDAIKQGNAELVDKLQREGVI